MKISKTKDVIFRRMKLMYDFSESMDLDQFDSKETHNALNSSISAQNNTSIQNSNNENHYSVLKNKNIKVFNPAVLTKNPRQQLSLLRIQIETKDWFKDSENNNIYFQEIESISTVLNVFDLNDEDIELF